MEKKGLRFSYDSEQDILYLHFKDGPAQSVREVEDRVIVELDRAGEVMGIEVWAARGRGLLRQLQEITVSK